MTDITDGEFIGPEETPSSSSSSTSSYGPKRVRTKELDIEQFDPRIIEEVEARKNNTLPSFCSSIFCVGVHKCDYQE